MSKRKPLYDVFLSFQRGDAPTAHEISKVLSKAGFAVFDGRSLPRGANMQDQIWEALAESTALVVVFAESMASANTAVEIGAAMAWAKPIYIVQPPSVQSRLPGYLGRYRIFSSNDLPNLAQAIHQDTRSLSEKDRALLVDLYRKFGMPTDQLSTQPGLLDRLSREFNKRASANVPGERLVQELFRLRKRGHLPSLRKPSN